LWLVKHSNRVSSHQAHRSSNGDCGNNAQRAAILYAASNSNALRDKGRGENVLSEIMSIGIDRSSRYARITDGPAPDRVPAHNITAVLTVQVKAALSTSRSGNRCPRSRSGSLSPGIHSCRQPVR